MNKISDEIINNVIQQHYDYIINKYDEKKFLVYLPMEKSIMDLLLENKI